MQLALRADLKASIRSRDASIIGNLGTDNPEARSVAESAQDKADIGSETNPLYGGDHFKGCVKAIRL